MCNKAGSGGAGSLDWMRCTQIRGVNSCLCDYQSHCDCQSSNGKTPQVNSTARAKQGSVKTLWHRTEGKRSEKERDSEREERNPKWMK